MNLTETQKAYTAGFFDGDGTISIQGGTDKKGNQHWALEIKFYNCNLKVLQTIKRWIGIGSIAERKRTSRWRINYALKVRGVSARNLLAEIYPYLIIKKPQAEIALEFSSTFTTYDYSGSSWRGGRKLKPATISKRKKLKAKLHELTLTANFVGKNEPERKTECVC